MLNIVKPEVHIEIPMALAPIPSLRADPERFISAEVRITTAAKQAMNGDKPLKGPLEVTLAIAYPPGSSQRRGHAWRVTAPTTWGLAKFVVSLFSGICFVSAGQVAKLTVEKTYGAKALNPNRDSNVRFEPLERDQV
jgi:hypothetical protein